MARYPSNYASPYGDGDGKSKKIRCRQCGQRALSNLVICPHCGRELYPAPSPLLIWGVPLALAALFFFIIYTWGGTSPIMWMRDVVNGALAQLIRLEAQMEPGAADPPIVSVITPITPDQSVVTPIVIVAEADAEGRSGEPEVALAATATETPAPTLIVSPTATLAPIVVTATEMPTDTPMPPTDTVEPTATPQPTATLPPTATPLNGSEAATRIAASLTALPATRTATAEETSNAVAFVRPITETVLTLETPITATLVSTASTSLTTTVLSDPTATSTSILTPTLTSTPTSAATSTPTEAPTVTPTVTPSATATSLPTNTFAPTVIPTNTPASTSTPVPTSTPVIYVIRSGDTLLVVAQQYDVPVEAIMQANNLSNDDLRRLRPGQELVIPVAGSGVAPAITNQSESPSPTPIPRTYTVQPGDNPTTIANRFGVSVDALLRVNGLSRDDASRLRVGQTLIIPSDDQSGADGASLVTVSSSTGFRLDAPQLRSPEDGTPMRCSVQDSLVWQPLSFMAPGDKYIMYLGYVGGYHQDGSEQINWVLQQDRDRSRTSWDMDSNYCALAPQELGRQWRWYVVVVDENNVPVSPRSTIWRFTWN